MMRWGATGRIIIICLFFAELFKLADPALSLSSTDASD